MNVTLNGNPFDVTVERERTLGELLAGVESWLESSRFSVSAFSLNGKAVPVGEVEEACATDLDEIDTLDIRASSWSELLLEALAESARCLEDAERGNEEEAATRFDSGAASGFLAGGERDLHRRIREALRDGTEAERREALRRELADRMREIADPAAELVRVRERIADVAERLEAVPLELQTGKDAAAARTIGDFASLAETMLRLIPLAEAAGLSLSAKTVDGSAFSDFMDELTTALRELAAGYENGDAILVGDLAEYELAPRLRTLAAALAEGAAKER